MGCSSRADDADVYERRYNGVATHDVHDVIIFAVSPRITYGIEGSGAMCRQTQLDSRPTFIVKMTRKNALW